jgi:DNA repair photolyase
MGLNRSKGQMYEWVSHTWAAIQGCTYQCSYCYVKSFKPHPPKMSLELPFPNLYSKWRNDKGEWITLKTIFVAHCSDLFAADENIITTVLNHCKIYHRNSYVFQTRNTKRVLDFLPLIPENSMIGTTIETNRNVQHIGGAPSCDFRSRWLKEIPKKTFVTIEPILDFDLQPLLELIVDAKPSFVNIGADSKQHYLQEPSKEKILSLLSGLTECGIEIRQKSNLERLLK